MSTGLRALLDELATQLGVDAKANLALLLPLAATKAVTTSKASSTAITADPELTLSMAANTSYRLRLRLHYTAGTAGDLALGFNLPTGARMDGSARGLAVGNTTTSAPLGATAAIIPFHVAGPATTTANVGQFGGGTLETTVEIDGIVTTGSTAGALTLVYGQVTSNSTATALLPYSRLELTPVTAPVSMGGNTGTTPVTPLFTDTFDGTQTGWPAQWVLESSGASATLVAGRAKLVPSAVNYIAAREVRTDGGAISGDGTLYGEIYLPDIGEQYVFLSIRDTTANTYNPNGYYVMLKPANSGGGYEVGRGNGAAGSTLISYGTVSYVAGHTYGIKLNINGTTIISKVWDLAGAEPGWDPNGTVTVTGTLLTSGYIGYTVQSGSTTNVTAQLDNVSWTAGPLVEAGGTGTSTTSGTGTEAPNGGPTGVTFTRTFTDDFSGSSVDASKWASNWYGEGGVMNGAGTYAANSTVSGGALRQRLVDSSHGALIHTDITNGYRLPVGSYIETRVSIPGNAQGKAYNWFAFWASTGSPDSWPSDGEHDIVEILSGVPTVNYHGPSSDQNLGTSAGTWIGNGFHTYALHRKTATTADVYWDGVKVKSYTTTDSGKPEILIFNVGQGDYPGYGATGEVVIDYVRAWSGV